MVNNKLRITIFLAIAICMCAIITGCGKTKKSTSLNEKVLSSVEVVAVDNKYTINNNEIHVLYGEDINFAKRDFCIIVYFDNNTWLTVEENFEFSTNITQNSSIGEYKLEFKYENLIKEIKVIINPFNITSDNVIVNGVYHKIYTGLPIEQELSVKMGDKVLLKDIDYTIEYINNVNIGVSSVIVTGKGNFVGNLELTFEILPADINNAKIEFDNDFVYTGNEIKPEIEIKYNNVVLVENIDFTVEIFNNIDATNNAYIKIKGIGNFRNELTKNFKISPKVLPCGEWVYTNDYIYTGDIYEVKLTNLPSEVDVKYSCNTGIDAGIYNAIADFKLKEGLKVANYVLPSKQTLKWEINPASLEKANIMIESGLRYTGNSIEPEIIVKLGNVELLSNKDYLISYYNNINASNNAKVVIRGKGNYCGEVESEFTILPQEINFDVSWNYDLEGFAYCGKEYVVNLLQIPDCVEASYTNNSGIDADYYVAEVKYKIKESDKNNYILSKTSDTLNWQIKPAKISRGILNAINSQVYTGYELKPQINIFMNLYNESSGQIDNLTSLKEGVDYTVEYLNNVNVGNASVIIKGIGNYDDEIVKNFEIIKILDESENTWPTNILQDFGIVLTKPTFGKVDFVNTEDDFVELRLTNVNVEMFNSIIEELYNNNEFSYLGEGLMNKEDLLLEDDGMISFSARNSEQESYVLCDITYIITDNNYYNCPKNTIIFYIEQY